MRYEKGHKDATRRRILEVASRQFRENGVAAAGLAGIMAKAGLTNGAFYAHFKSKDALVAAAIGKMFESARTRWEKTAGLGAYIEWYLSAEHRDARETGCPVVALASDVPRLSKACRTALATSSAIIMPIIQQRSEDILNGSSTRTS